MPLDQTVSRAHLRHLRLRQHISDPNFDLWGPRERCAKDLRRNQRYFRNLMTKWRVIWQGKKVILAPPGKYILGAQVFASDIKVEAESKAIAYQKIGKKK